MYFLFIFPLSIIATPYIYKTITNIIELYQANVYFTKKGVYFTKYELRGIHQFKKLNEFCITEGDKGQIDKGVFSTFSEECAQLIVLFYPVDKLSNNKLKIKDHEKNLDFDGCHVCCCRNSYG